jgi:hypothetical protein
MQATQMELGGHCHASSVVVVASLSASRFETVIDHAVCDMTVTVIVRPHVSQATWRVAMFGASRNRCCGAWQ